MISYLHMIKPWEKIGETRIPHIYFNVWKPVYRMPHGGEKTFELIETCDVSVVCPLTKDNEVVMVRQYRPGPEEVLLELPAGAVDDEEYAQDSAKRELLEETGYEGICTYLASSPVGAYSSRRKHIYVAVDCVKTHEQNLGHNEYADVELVSLETFRKHLREGNFSDVDAGYLALDYLNML